MEISDLLKLIEAGYTKDDISALLQPDQAADPEEKEEDSEEKDSAPEEQKPDQPGIQPQPDVITDDYMQQIISEISKLTKAMQRSNILTNDSSNKKTVRTDDEIIASIIGGKK